MTDRVLFVVFPKSGTGLLHAIRGVKHHVPMFNERGEFRTGDNYAKHVFECDQCTGHIPYSSEFQNAVKSEGYRIIFIFRNLRDVAVSLVNYVRMKENSELNVMTHGVRLSRREDPILSAIEVVAGWWEHFAPWMDNADALYTYRELRGAALLLGNEEDSFTFLHGNINEWQREFQPHHIEAARQRLPDVLKQYNLIGYYEDEREAA